MDKGSATSFNPVSGINPLLIVPEIKPLNKGLEDFFSGNQDKPC